jgi:hypothetical protein
MILPVVNRMSSAVMPSTKNDLDIKTKSSKENKYFCNEMAKA